MVKLWIDNQEVNVEKGTTILDAAASVGIKIPTLCFLKDLNEIGACRVCIVEIKGKDALVAACNTLVAEGMEIYTNSKRVMNARRTNVGLILSQHDYRCATCVRSGNCSLQKLANDLDILEVPFKEEYEEQEWNMDFPLIRDAKKCIKCMRCVQVCDKIQGMKVWDIINTGKRTNVGLREGMSIEDVNCALCGQCITHCPVGALRERDDLNELVYAIADKKKVVVAQIAPAVRAAWGERFGLKREDATVKRLVAALRRTGIDYVFDTNFTADLTIMEEANEFIERLKNKDKYKSIAKKIVDSKKIFFLGRGLDYAIMREGDLKLKEITYLSSECYAAGELKHGPISLIDKDTLVIAGNTNKLLYEKTESNLSEVRARGANIILVTNKGADDSNTIIIPERSSFITPMLEVIPLQLISYYTGLLLERDIDKPRNLAKSVTVE